MRVIGLIMFLSTAALALEATIRDGEKLTFDVKYGVISAAQATLEIKSSALSKTQVWLITSEAKTYPFFDSMFKVRDKVESYWAKDKLRTLRFTKRLNEGKYRQFRVQTLDHEKKTGIYQSWQFKNQKFTTKQLIIPENTQDILSSFYYARQQNLKPGKGVLIDITTDGKSYKTEVVVHRRETIDSIFGKKQCLVIEPKLRVEAIFKNTGRILIWVTDDEYKVPLKMSSQITFGSFVATLKSADNVPYPLK